MTDETDDAVEPRFTKPTITSPQLSSTVSPGFLIEAYAPPMTIVNWRLEIMIPGYKFEFTPNWTLFPPRAWFEVPKDLIPPGGFWFQIDYNYGAWSPWAQSGDMVMSAPATVPAPRITLPPPGVIGLPRPLVSGRGAPFANIKLYLAGSGIVEYGSATVDSNGRWETTLKEDLPMADPFSMIAGQSFEGTYLWSDQVNYVVLFPPVIHSATAEGNKPIVTGTGGFSGAKLEIGEVGGSVFMSDTVRSDGSWTVAAQEPWVVPGTYRLQARQVGPVTSQPSSWRVGPSVEIKPLKPPPPDITYPNAGSTHPAFVRVAGTCEAGARVFVQYHDGSFLKDATVTGRNWFLDFRWTAGKKDVKAVQVVAGVTSDPGGIFTFYVQPEKPVITPPATPVALKQTLDVTRVESGAVILKMLRSSGVEVQGNFEGNGNSRKFIPSQDWLTGSNTVKVVQSVDGVPAESDPCTFTVELPTADPKITGPTVPTTQRPTFTGTGHDKATIEVYLERVPSFIAARGTVSGVTWEAHYLASASNMTPGVWAFLAKQTFNQKEKISQGFVIKIKPSTPLILPLDSPGMKEPLWIRGLDNMSNLTVEVFNAKGRVEGTVTHSGGSGTFTPEQDWGYGEHKVWAVATVEGVRSDESLPVTFSVKPAPPRITSPTEPTTQPPEIGGTGLEGAEVALYKNSDHSNPIATAVPVIKGEWHTVLKTVLPAGRVLITARQTFTGQPSDFTSPAFELKIKPSTPLISPLDSPGMKEPLMISGLDNMSNLTVEVFNAKGRIEGELPNTGTTRKFTPKQDWGYGEHEVWAQAIVDSVLSDASLPVTFSVKPAPPVIQLPPDPAEPRQALYISLSLTHSPELEVFVDEHTPVDGSVSVDGAGLKFVPDNNWRPGPQAVYAVQTVDGLKSDPGPSTTVNAKPPRVSISSPETARPDQPLTVTDVYPQANTIVTLFDAQNKPIPGKIDGIEDIRTFTPDENWQPGLNKVKAIQTAHDVDSDLSEECVFTVEEEGEKPDAPRFQEPSNGSKTPMHPHIKVIGLPLSTITVRLKDAGELCSAPADAEGVLAFRVNEPLLPGPTVLQTRQKVDGPSSDWRERSFTVKEPPEVPRIEAPQPGRPTGRVPTIRGAAQTRGQIQLRHEGDAEDEHFGTTRGVMQWSWKAQEAWDLGTYTIQARHEDEGDCSEWTDPVTFEVVDSLYAIGDALPVLAEPVVGKDQRARLRVQVVSGTTGQPAANANVEWRRKGQQEILATTKTDDSGWTEFLYIPDIAGLNEVLAYIANNNDAVEMTELFSVNALTDNGWDSQAVFYLDGELVDLAKGDIVLLKGKVYSLELRVKSGSPLVGSMVILQDLWEAQEAGLQFAPAIGVPQLVEEGKPVVWSISFAEGDGVHFGLKLTSPVLPDWRLPGRISDPVEEVEVNFDSFPKLFGGDPVYPCFGASHTFLVKPTTQSLLLGEEVMLALTEEAASLGVVLTPNTAQKMVEGGVTWTLDCINSVNAGNFAAQLKVPAWNFSSRELAMSLGHNKVSRAETFGPQEMGGAGSYWMYGIRVISTFTGQNAGGVPVIVRVAGRDPVHGVTERSGWIYVNYYDGQTASFQIDNRYDGSTAG